MVYNEMSSTQLFGNILMTCESEERLNIYIFVCGVEKGQVVRGH